MENVSDENTKRKAMNDESLNEEFIHDKEEDATDEVSEDGQNSKEDEACKANESKEEVAEENYKNKYLYLLAEMDNLKKRTAKERENLLKYGNKHILEELLEVVDNFDRTIGMIGQDKDEKVQNIVVGVEMVSKQLLEILGRFGLTEIKSLGQDFDPNLHEAMSQKEAEGKKDQEIIEVLQKGYKLNGTLLRASKVIVAKNS